MPSSTQPLGQNQQTNGQRTLTAVTVHSKTESSVFLISLVIEPDGNFQRFLW
jgi:hypothetical protein